MHLRLLSQPLWLLPVLPVHARSLAQLLLVLDDADLHKRQTPFSLGTSRAVASTLNSLVFHTAFPEAAGQQHQQPGQQLKQQPAALQELSAQVAPATLAHGMVGAVSTAGLGVQHAGYQQQQPSAIHACTCAQQQCPVHCWQLQCQHPCIWSSCPNHPSLEVRWQ